MRRGLPSLRRAKLVRGVQASFASCCDRQGFRLVHYSLQRDHAHLIVEADDRAALARGMKAVGARLSRAVNRIFGRSGSVLADRYHVRVLKTPLEVRRAITYVLLNARKHAKTMGQKLTDVVDSASSGAWFDGWKSRAWLDPGIAGRPPPVAHARCWLLRVGWKRHGLITTREVPGGRDSR